MFCIAIVVREEISFEKYWFTGTEEALSQDSRTSGTQVDPWTFQIQIMSDNHHTMSSSKIIYYKPLCKDKVN